jgi:hypothetical protein
MPRKRKSDGESRRPTADLPPVGAPSKSSPARAGGRSTPKYSDLVLLVHAGNQAEADLYKTELEAHGIPAVLEGEGSSLAGIGAGVPVLVPEEFADQAAEFIAELESAKPEDHAVDEKEELFEDEEERDELEELDALEDLDEDDLDEDDDLEDEDDAEEDDDWDEDEEKEAEEEEKEDEDWDDDDEDWDDDDA